MMKKAGAQHSISHDTHTGAMISHQFDLTPVHTVKSCGRRKSPTAWLAVLMTTSSALTNAMVTPSVKMNATRNDGVASVSAHAMKSVSPVVTAHGTLRDTNSAHSQIEMKTAWKIGQEKLNDVRTIAKELHTCASPNVAKMTETAF